MHRITTIDFSTSAETLTLCLEIDGRSRSVPLQDAGVYPLDDALASRFHAAARSSVGLNFFSWWQSLDGALSREFGNDLPCEVVAATARLEYAMLLACLDQRGVTLRDYLKSGRHGIDLGCISARLKGRAVSEFLADGDCPYVATAVLQRISPEEFCARVTPNTGRCLIYLTGSPPEDVESLRNLASSLNGEQRRCEWVLHGNNSFPDAAALRLFWHELQSVTCADGRQPRMDVIIDPLVGPAATSNHTLATFVEWPDRPRILAGKTARGMQGLRHAMEIGYRGVYVTDDCGPVDLILRACLIRSHQQLEPVARWTILFSDDTFPPGIFQSLQHELIRLF